MSDFYRKFACGYNRNAKISIYEIEGTSSMDRHLQQVNVLYDTLMFANTPKQAQTAARELVKLVLGENALNRPLDESLRAVCRRLRPAEDAKEQARFEAEFLELVSSPTSATHTMAA
jgi:hypothetical protein